MADNRTEALVNAFLQNKNMEQRQDYLTRGRRFAGLEVGLLNEDWIAAVRNWLVRKDRTTERMMDDLAAELRLRGLEPKYDAVKKELADRYAQLQKTEQTKTQKEVARRIGKFLRESQRPLQ